MVAEETIQGARRVLNLDPIIARLGYGDGTVYDLQNTGYYWVRKTQSDGTLSRPFSLPLNPLASFPPKDGLPVVLGYDLFGNFCVYAANPVGMKAANVNPLILNPLDTAVYGKTSQTNLATLYYQRHADTVTYPFRIVVFPAPIIINGVADFFPSGFVDVDTFVPSSELHCFVSVFVRTDMTLEAFASTPINLSDPLTVASDIQQCIHASSANSVIICAYELQGGDTKLSPLPTRNVDMRQIVNTGSSSGGSLTVTDGSTTITDVTEIDFNGTDFTITDLTGGVVQIDLVTPSVQVFPEIATMWHDEMKVTNGNAKVITHDTAQNYNTWTDQSTSANGDQFTNGFILKAGTYNFNLIDIKNTSCK